MFIQNLPYRFLLLIAISLIPIYVKGQSQPIFQKISQTQGLSNGRVTGIVKDTTGFIWIATKNGLNRYDGKTFKVYNKQNSGLSANDISDLLVDSHGRLWVSTLGGGVNLYDATLDEFISFKHNTENALSITSNQVNTVFEDGDGDLWFGTENGLSLLIEPFNVFVSYSNKLISNPEINHNSITSIQQTEEDFLYIGTFGGGLYRFYPKTASFTRIVSEEGFFTDFIHCLESLNDSTLLAGTSGGGLLAFNTQSGTYSNFLEDSPFQDITIVRALLRDAESTLWIGTDGHGLIKKEKGEEWRMYQHNAQLKHALSGNAVYALLEDDEANIWIGTAWSGVNVVNKSSNVELLYSDITGEKLTPVLAVYRHNDRLLFGLDGDGLTYYNQETGELKYFGKEQGFPGRYVQHIQAAKDGTYWLGTFANGLIKLNPEEDSWIHYKHADKRNSLNYNDVRYVLEDEPGHYWIATWGGGLNYFDAQQESFVHYRERDRNSINSDNVISLLQTGDSLWIATFGGGVNVLNTKTGTFRYVQFEEGNSNSLSGNNIFCLFKDSRGYMWIGTSGEGINRLNLQTGLVERFEEYKAVRYSTVTAIEEDEHGDIWFSTKKGIFRYSYEGNDFTSLPDITGEFHINAAMKDEEGSLYFGGIDGVVHFKPEEVQYRAPQLPVVFTNFKLFNKEVPVGMNARLPYQIGATKDITLPHYLDVVTFDFAALQFPFSDDTEYAIRLEGFDNDWRYIGSDRTATYTNLSPGHYQFNVKSKLAAGNWDRPATSINLTILKPFWYKWWAMCFYGLIIIGLFYLFRKYTVAWERMKTNLKLERLTHEKDIELYNFKQQFFTNISHEIRTPVTLILSAVRKALGNSRIKNQKDKSSIESIERNSQHLLHLVNELLDFKKFEDKQIELLIRKSDFVAFSKEIYLSFVAIAEQKDIDYSFEANVEEAPLWFDKNQMEKVVYNLLSNAFKFTDKGGTIKVQLLSEDEVISLQVYDSGVGVPQKKLTKIFNRFYQLDNAQLSNEGGFGLGLSISKEIVSQHKGEIFAESEKGKGSVFTVKLQTGTSHYTQEQLSNGLTASEDWEKESSAVMKQVSTNGVDELPEAIPALKEKQVMVVEDNAEIRHYLKEILEKYCTVLEAANGEEAWELAREESPDIIVSDVMMPVMDGIALTRKLKKDIRTSHIPVILLTARTALVYKKEGFDIGADEYITKPFDEPLLLTRIKNLIHNRELMQVRFSKEAILSANEISDNQNDQVFLEKLVQIIQNNLDSETLNASFLSKEMGMSHSVIYKKTKALTGMTYVEFVRNHKLLIAKKLIAEEGFSVSAACYKVGYSDRKYFSKQFKKKFGVNPSELTGSVKQN